MMDVTLWLHDCSNVTTAKFHALIIYRRSHYNLLPADVSRHVVVICAKLFQMNAHGRKNQQPVSLSLEKPHHWPPLRAFTIQPHIRSTIAR